MIKVKREGVLLSKTDFEFENEGVLNPAVIKVGNSVHIYYRAVRNGNHSTIGYCRLEGPLTVVERWIKPFIFPEFDYESQGVEDPRIVKIDDTYYMTYTGYDGTNARGALAISKDLINFEKLGLIVPAITYAEFVSMVEKAGKVNENYYTNQSFYYQAADPEQKMILWDKNLVFFPRKIKGKFVFLHRIRPGIQIVSIKSLEDLTKRFWKKYFRHFQKHIVMDPLFKHESSYIGSGCPPIETKHGWLLIYHGVEETKKGLVYSACAAALLDLNDPTRVIARRKVPILQPEMDYELRGQVNNVVFPCGAVVIGDELFVYYGGADSVIGVATMKLSELLRSLTSWVGQEQTL